MDNLLNIDNMDMIRMLGFLHENVKPITHNTVQYTEDGIVNIVDLNDKAIIKAKEANIAIFGTFVIVGEQPLVRGWGWGELHKVTVVNLLSGVSKEFKIETLREVKSLGSDFISMEEFGARHTKNIVYNKFIEPIYDFGYITFIKIIEDNPLKTIIDYRDSTYSGEYRTLILNKKSATVDIYDSVDIDTERQLVAIGKEWEPKGPKKPMCGKLIPSVRYMLSNHGKLVGKCYNAIETTNELSRTDYLLVHNLSSEYRLDVAHCQGIIDINGVEWIPPVYDKVSYIGANTFLLYFNNFVNGYAIGKGELFKNIPESNIWIHQTLPMVIIKNVNNYVAIDVFGRQFDTSDIAKYFEVCISNDYEDAFRIDTGYKTVYTYRNLIPITNLHQVHILSTCKWEKI